MAIPASLQQGLKLPVIAAPMFLVSGPDLVIAACKSGVIGTFPALRVTSRPRKAPSRARRRPTRGPSPWGRAW